MVKETKQRMPKLVFVCFVVVVVFAKYVWKVRPHADLTNSSNGPRKQVAAGCLKKKLKL